MSGRNPHDRSEPGQVLINGYGYTAWVGGDALVKLASETLSIFEILSINFLVGALHTIMITHFHGGLRQLYTTRSWFYLGCSALIMAATYGSVAGVIYLSLADFYTIIFSSLLILAVLESKILKKHVDSNEWLTIIFGFVGVVIAVQYTDSSTSTLSWVGVGVTCLASLSLALVILSTRASGSESNYALSFWPQVVNCLVCIGVLLASEGVVTNRTGITFSLYAG